MSIDKFGRVPNSAMQHHAARYSFAKKQGFEKRLSEIEKLVVNGRIKDLDLSNQIVDTNNQMEKQIAELKSIVANKCDFSEVEQVKNNLNLRIDDEIRSLVSNYTSLDNKLSKQFQEQKQGFDQSLANIQKLIDDKVNVINEMQKKIQDLNSTVSTKIDFSEVEQVRVILNFRIDDEVKKLNNQLNAIVDTILVSKTFQDYIQYRLDVQSFNIVSRYIDTSAQFSWSDYKSHGLSDHHIKDLLLNKMELVYPEDFFEARKEAEEG